MAVPPFRVKAVYDYNSPHDDDLSFPNGQIITVTDEEDADWYFGEYADANGAKQEGLFPRNFVERYEPETPPRPSRSTRAKKEPEAPQPPPEPVELEAPEHDEPEHELEAAPTIQTVRASTKEPLPPEVSMKQTEATTSRSREGASDAAVDPLPPQKLPTRQQSHVSSSKPSSLAPSNTPSRSTGETAAAPSATKPAPPPVVEKPISGSFKDRIAAFNKPTGPVAPVKPAGLGQPGGSGFIKKPFVAPPPSKNAYVPPPREPPPQKVYRREEEPDVPATSTTRPVNEADPTPSAERRDAEDEDQPKPTSLKERIALLQKQQMEQAARQAQGGQKKEKPKKPPKKRTESDHALDGMAADAGQSQPSQESNDVPRNVTDANEEAPVARSKGKELSKVPSIPSQVVSDGNEADQSGAGDTEEGDVSTGYDDADEKPIRRAPTADQGTRPFGAPPTSVSTREGQREQTVRGEAHDSDGGDNNDKAEDEDEEEEEEEEIDPEVRKRQEIRERMAKMSGGMGMAGMFGPPMGFSPMASKSGKTTSKKKDPAERDDFDHGESTAPRMLPIPGMALPGMQRPREPKAQEAEVSKEDEEVAVSTLEQPAPVEVPNVEDIGARQGPRPQDVVDAPNVASPLQGLLPNTISLV